MNRDEKAVAIAEIATEIEESSAIFAVDYRGITVPDAAELRAKLREADATFKVVKNSLTERAADQVGAETLKEFLSGPTALTFVRGDVAVAAKAIADQGRATQLLPFKGGLMDGAPLDPDQIRSISRLPSRETLYGQLVGIVAAPVGGLVRSLNALVSGLAIALGQVQEKKVRRDPRRRAAGRRVAGATGRARGGRGLKRCARARARGAAGRRGAGCGGRRGAGARRARAGDRGRGARRGAASR